MTKQDKQVCVVKSWQEGPLIDESTLSDDLTRHFYYTLGRDVVGESQLYLYHALALTIRDRLVARCRDTNKQIKQHKRRKTAYLSLEFLMGRALGNAVLNLDLEAQVSTALQAYCTELKM